MNAKQLSLVVASAALLSNAPSTLAEGRYGLAQFAQTEVSIDNSDWEPNSLVLGMGYIKEFSAPDVTSNGYVPVLGFGLEGRLGTGLGGEDSNGIDLEVSNLFGVYSKLNWGRKYAPYLIAGLTNVELDTDASDEDSEIDFSYGYGIDISVMKKGAINLEFMNYYDNSDVEVSAVSLGFKYEF